MADYVAEVLAEFSRTERARCVVPGQTTPLDYFFEMLAALQTADDRTSFLIRVHIGNYSLFLSGVFPDRIRFRAEARGFPDLKYYEALGRTQYRAASDHRLAQRYELAGDIQHPGGALRDDRLALNDIADRYFSSGIRTMRWRLAEAATRTLQRPDRCRGPWFSSPSFWMAARAFLRGFLQDDLPAARRARPRRSPGGRPGRESPHRAGRTRVRRLRKAWRPVSSRHARRTGCSRRSCRRTGSSGGYARWPVRWCWRRCKWAAPLPQRRLELDHRFNRDEDVGEEVAELREVAAEAGDARRSRRRIAASSRAPDLILNEQGGLVDDTARSSQDGHLAARGDSPRGNGVIEIHQDFAQIKDNWLSEQSCHPFSDSQHFPSAFERAAQGQFIGELQPACRPAGRGRCG